MDETDKVIDEQLSVMMGLVPSSTPGPTSPGVAKLLFEEAKELVYNSTIRFIVDRGVDTGARIGTGHQTVPFNRLGTPNGMTVAGVASGFVEHGDIYDHKHGDRLTRWGILLLGCDEVGNSHWLWSQVWIPCYTDPVCYELDISGLAELMEPKDGHKPILHPIVAYEGFVRLIERKMDLQRMVHDRLGRVLYSSEARLDRLCTMANITRTTF